MPCTYSVVSLKEREAEREREREARRLSEEERRKKQVLKKKKALFVALNALGFEVSAESIDNENQTLIIGKEKDNG